MEIIKLSQLNSNIRNAAITALIICKQNPNIFQDRAVIEMTLRDSINDYTSCVFWGSEAFIESCNNCNIGDLVTIKYPQIKSGNGEKNIYKPQSSSTFSLTVNEGCGEIIINRDDNQTQRFQHLRKIPIIGTNSLVQLADINSIVRNSTTKKFVDCLVCVRLVKVQREITTKLGKKLSIREVIVFDQSCNGMLLTIFNQNYVENAENWRPFSTILYLSDVQVEFSEFHRTAILTLAKRTIITENPASRKTIELQAYVRCVPREMDISFSTEIGLPECKLKFCYFF